MLRMLPCYVEEDFDDPELTAIFNNSEKDYDDELSIEEERAIKEKEKEHEELLRKFLRLKHKLIVHTKEYDEEMEFMLQVSEGKIVSKLKMTDIIKSFKEKFSLVENAKAELKKCNDELQKCKEILSKF